MYVAKQTRKVYSSIIQRNNEKKFIICLDHGCVFFFFSEQKMYTFNCKVCLLFKTLFYFIIFTEFIGVHPI